MHVLITDDESNIRSSIAKLLKLEGITSREAADGREAADLLREEFFDAAIVDLKMPVMGGMELLEWINSSGPDIPVIIISAFGEIKDAVNAMKLGAVDYVVKPFDPDELIIKLKKTVEGRIRLKASEGEKEHLITGKSPVILKIKELIGRLAKARSNVLITGESGTGKEMAARMIHETGQSGSEPVIPVYKAGIPDTLLESELFGYEKGAFTGAVSRKVGLFEAASGGTIFLDEIGDMPAALQVKILRVLQERKIQRLGSTVQIPVDLRVIAATHRDLEEAVKSGEFREDLYYRLNVVKIHLPPLRERLEDISLIAPEIVKRLNIKLSTKIKTISPEALSKLQSYPFPGNIRELENILERAIIFTDGDTITPKNIDLPVKSADNSEINLIPTTVKGAEKQTIIEALRKNGGNRTKSALELGISRRTLINKINEYDLR